MGSFHWKTCEEFTSHEPLLLVFYVTREERTCVWADFYSSTVSEVFYITKQDVNGEFPNLILSFSSLAICHVEADSAAPWMVILSFCAVKHHIRVTEPFFQSSLTAETNQTMGQMVISTLKPDFLFFCFFVHHPFCPDEARSVAYTSLHTTFCCPVKVCYLSVLFLVNRNIFEHHCWTYF